MGLFSSTTKTYVASSAWNMAGDFKDRAPLLPSLVLSSTLSNSKQSLVDQIQSSLRNPMTMRNRTYFQWARSSHYYGMPTGTIAAMPPAQRAAVGEAMAEILGVEEPNKLHLQTGYVGAANFTVWAEYFIYQNYPYLLDDEWDVVLGGDGLTMQITIMRAIPPEEVWRTHTIALDADFLWAKGHPSRRLLYASYQIETVTEETTIDPETEEEITTTSSEFSDRLLFTYRMGSGNAVLDAFDTSAVTTLEEFLPPVLIRLNNTSIADMEDGAAYHNMKTAFTKMTGGLISNVLSEIDDHESVDDMDHVMVVPGASLNTQDDASRAYIYLFFQTLAQSQSPGFNEIRITLADLPEFDFRIMWGTLEETLHVGNIKHFDGNTSRTPAKKGEYWFRKLPDIDLSDPEDGWSVFSILGADKMRRILLLWQETATTYRQIYISDLTHMNYVYDSKAVMTTDTAAMEDEEEESGFIIPLHYPTLLKMNVLQQAQLGNCSCYLLVNSYQRVKVRWWQRGFFRIVTLALAFAFSVITAGTSLGSAVGLLGTNASVGLAVGASVSMAALVGAAVNAMAAIALTMVITQASTLVFGDKWGALIGAVVSFFAMSFGTSLVQSGALNLNWATFLQANNLLGLTRAVGNGYMGYLAAQTQEMQGELNEIAENYEEWMDEIQERSRDILGMTNPLFDPMMLTDATEQFVESPQGFLARTLMTGSDVASLTKMAIDDFVDMTLELPSAPSS